MQLGEVIRTHRKKRNLTQEEMARRLGVTAPAVNKWEHGNACPDISLLAPIARLLDISLDTLLSFREDLTTEEINGLVADLNRKLRSASYEEVFRWAEAQLREYPNCGQLAWQLTVCLDAWRLSNEIPDTEQYEETILDWYVRALESGDEDVRIHAADSLFGYYLRKEQFEKAEACLSYFSKENPERKRKQALLYEKQGRTKEAYRTYEELLFAQYQMTSSLFQNLYFLARKDGDREKAGILVDKQRQLARLFEMGTYHEVSLGLDLAVAEQDAEATLDIMERMLAGVETMGDFTRSPLFSHMTFRPLSPDFLAEVKETLQKGFREEEIYGYLKGDPRWEALDR